MSNEEEEEGDNIDATMKALLDGTVNFGVFELSVDQTDEGMELKVVNSNNKDGLAFRCDGAMRPIDKEEAIREVLTR